MTSWTDNDTLMWWLGAASILTFIGTLIVVPMVLVRLPANYLTGKQGNGKTAADQPAPLKLLWHILRNVLGYFFILLGILLLVLPGQGLLTIFIGVLLADFPGRQKLLRWIVSRKPVLNFINRRRKKAGKKPLKI